MKIALSGCSLFLKKITSSARGFFVNLSRIVFWATLSLTKETYCEVCNIFLRYFCLMLFKDSSAWPKSVQYLQLSYISQEFEGWGEFFQAPNALALTFFPFYSFLLIVSLIPVFLPWGSSPVPLHPLHSSHLCPPP